jgi:hypothetical protein
MLVWHSVHAWNWVVWLWKDGALGAALNVEFVWHWKQSRFTVLNRSM